MIKKPSLLKSNPAAKFTVTRIITLRESDIEVEIDDDAVVSQRRYRFVFDQDQQDDDLSDYVKFRLWLARQLALRKFSQTWT